MLRAVGDVGRRFRDSMSAFASVWRNPNLRWLELAWAASSVGYFAHVIVVSVYAYEIAGAQAVGLLFLARLIPAALISPFAGMLGDRYPRERVLLITNVTRVILIAISAVAVYAESAPWIVYGLSIAVAIATTPFRSAQAALTPGLSTSPQELTAANAVASAVESLAVFVGPALAGLVLAVSGTGGGFVAALVLVVASTGFLLLMSIERKERPRAEIEASTLVHEALAGFRAIWNDSSLRVMMLVLTAQTAVAGLVQVFIVVMALELLDLGDGGVGFLNSAIGVGALIGAVGALSLTGVQRLTPPFMVGNLMWGVPLIVIGIWPEPAVALALFALIGLGNSVADVAGLTIVQRAFPDDVLARVFGVIQMLWLAAIGIGAAVAPPLISWLGIEAALIATGIAMIVLVGALWPRVSRIDAGAPPPAPEELRLLGSIPIFSPLPGASLENLAGRLVPLRLDPGEVVVREGDAGDRFYIVTEGEVDVTEAGKPLSTLAAGGYFGEIALLRDVPRTATVTARTPVVLYALDREDFLAAVTSHAPSEQAAEEVVSARLAGAPTRTPAG